ncbi:hypothetical protein CONCODRAFT_13465 [Conidiobolus coronatus NRRL 28638]|uniref:Ricin B lectin domain-containing protein n=1 Tax=Conidiobolus coronatus (strain ATCC 28846 / CBS 209.66 / NRRL 28638) TaxID=796925 RepID=A0A137NQN4_CONC2|nr:hypothetical protein CONCODRAFT_13465 [Conidiobolus coronatus NRRL 28638]|eukprot:KXN65075.1 hypothetical protein CONCODRAFT_13465 [Conidiobolus coronatus NRRL 28638]
MLLIKVNYFVTFLTLLPLVVCQLPPGHFYIRNSAFNNEVLAASEPAPNSKVVIEPINNSRTNLEVWNFNSIGGNELFDIVLQNSNFHLSVVNNQVVISLNPFSWRVTHTGDNLYELSPVNQALIHNNLNAGTSSSRQEVNLAPPNDLNTQKWIIHP